jgi:hypothetical protein
MFKYILGESGRNHWSIKYFIDCTHISDRKEEEWTEEQIPTRNIEYDVPINNPLCKCLIF